MSEKFDGQNGMDRLAAGLDKLLAAEKDKDAALIRLVGMLMGLLIESRGVWAMVQTVGIGLQQAARVFGGESSNGRPH